MIYIVYFPFNFAVSISVIILKCLYKVYLIFGGN